MSAAPAAYQHFGIAVASYDATIVRYIPHYRELIDTLTQWLEGHVPADAHVIDLGCGTGALAAAVAAALPAATIELVDADPGMLTAAQARLAADAARVRVRQGDFADALGTCDAVVASLSLHHVPTPDAKRALYTSIHAALRPGGALLIGDCVLYPDGRGEARARRDWAAHMQAHGLTDAEAHAAFAQWNAEDHYLPLATELALLRAAGFARPDVYWRRGPCAVYGGFRE